MTYLLRLSACLFFLLSFNAKALVVNGCTIEPFTSCIGADLSNININGASINNAIFFGANLSNSDLSQADLRNVNFQNSWARHSNFSDSDMSLAYAYNANFSYANLANANLYGANLTFAYFYESQLQGSNLFFSNLANTTFESANLSGVNLSFAQSWNSANFLNSVYSESTVFPTGFDPEGSSMIFVSEVPIPAGIYLFLSGLVGLGLMRGRNG